MNKQVLQMKYHPAMKEIIFKRFQNDKEIPIRNDSKLQFYMNLKGSFILQDQGNTFFDDIAKAFDGLKVINIEVITTKMDFYDFMEMVEYYNQDNKVKINPTILRELPDMKDTFKDVINYGEKAIFILKNHRQKMFNIPLENEIVKRSAENFAKQMDMEIKNIRGKIESFADNTVNICFTGVYSSGKSTLINAILGYRILPENIKSETAKMLQISSPKKDENIKIKFDINGEYSELEWDKEDKCFEFVKGPSESVMRTDIQEILNKGREKEMKVHQQINAVVEKLNLSMEVSSVIKIIFPISLDNENIKFTLYDTPGTDSNYYEHKNVLMEALEEQRQSILIFVAKPDALEGSGNSILLNILKEAENKNSKTTIDIGRSLFVINKADSQTADARATLQYEEIKNQSDSEFSIKLSDKKLFFTSALYAYAAKAVINNIDTQQEKGLLKNGKYLLDGEDCPMAYCYKQNRSAASEFATEKMIQECNTVLESARNKNNLSEIINICSGLYSLEREILQYGEKYASTVKAFAIIDSVNKALAKLTKKANSLKDNNRNDINEIEISINELKVTISQAIELEYTKTSIQPNTKLSEDILKDLKLNKESIARNIEIKADEFIGKTLKGRFFGLGKVKVKEKDKKLISDEIELILDQFTENFIDKREKLLEKQRDNFMEQIKDTISRNSNIDDTVKKFFMDIPAPEISKANITEIGDIYDSHKRVNKILLFKHEYLDKKGFKEDIQEKLKKITGLMADEFSKDYRNSLETLIMQIKCEFQYNLENYSLDMQAMIGNKDAMICLGEKITDAANALLEGQCELNEIIWKEKML